MMQVSAAVRLIPRPPARVDSRKTLHSGSVLNAAMAAWRSCQQIEPSMRQCCTSLASR